MNLTAKIVTALITLVIGVNLASVVVSAQDDVREYNPSLLTTHSDNGIIPETNITIQDWHTLDVVKRNTSVEINVNYVVESGATVNPMAMFQFVWNGTEITDCFWTVEGGTITGGRFNPTFTIYCDIGDVSPGNHTLEVTRTEVTGTPVSDSVYSFRIIQLEGISMGQTDFEAALGATGIEFLAWLAILAVAGFLATTRTGPRSGIVGALFGFLAIMVALLVFHAPFTILAVLAGVAAIAVNVKTIFGDESET